MTAICRAIVTVTLLLLAVDRGRSDEPVTRWKPYESGIACWYQARRTASGERFVASHLSAAHRKLPFGTLVRVTTIRTGRSCVVRINDRGPYNRGRIIDVSPAAAKMLGLTTSGIAKVKIEVEVK